MEKYEIAVIGGGPGGYVCAIRASQLGAKVVVIEHERLGGVCLNRGCIPTKTILASVNELRRARSGDSYGVRVKGEVEADIEAIWSRKEKVSDTLVKGIGALFKKNGVDYIEGSARFASPRELVVRSGDGERKISADKVVIATGSRSAALPGIEPDGRVVLTSKDMLAKPYVPERLLIIGAGAIGMEFSGIFSELGSKVVIVEMLPRPLPAEDEDSSAIIAREMKKRKIKLITGVKVSKLDRRDDGVTAELDNGDVIESDRVLVSIGRAFNTGDLDLDNAGITLGKRGEIPVNDKMETGVDGIYAIGDVVGGPLLAHVASRGGVVAAENATGGSAKIDLRALPACTFTHPEVASVGLREWQARERGMSVKVGRFTIRGLGMAQATGELPGEVKVVTDESNLVLGVHIVGDGASMMIHEATLAIQRGLTVDEWAKMIHLHPSMSEALGEAVEDVLGLAIHVAK